MAKLVLSMFVSVDGFICGPDGEFVPPAWSDDLARYWSGYAMQHAGRFLYGRVNFLFNKEFWESAESDPSSPAAGIDYAGQMNATPKTVFSTTLADDPGWNGTVVRDDLAGAVAHLKAQEERDLFLFGGAGIANSMIALDLPDEYRLMVTPSLLGAGKRLFDGDTDRRPLTLVATRPLDTGAVILHYRRPARS